MTYNYPHVIENFGGEKLIFKALQGDKLFVENYVRPGCGPVMHTHWQQDEALTVVEGRIGYQVQGQPEQFAGEGETILFKRGTPHRFWNAGKDTLHCRGWIQPANNVEFFLTSLFAAQVKSGKDQPEVFDGAYLMTRYASEFDLPGIPFVVKKLLIPSTYYIGKMRGKYDHFRDAPAPLKRPTLKKQ